MKKKLKIFLLLFLIILLALVVFLCEWQFRSIVPVGQVAGKWSLIFDDEFDGTALDTTKWTTCYPNFKVGSNECDHDGKELELYQSNEAMVNNGLTLRAEKKTVNAANRRTYYYTSGMISSGPDSVGARPHFSFLYGYVEIRAKIPEGQGMWPAFWTLPTDGSWPPEIDIFEISGNTPNVIWMTYHYPFGGESGRKWTAPFNFSANWHTYAVDWEPNAITWYIDGVERCQYTNRATITTKPMYLLANLAVGGKFSGDPNASTEFPDEYQIAYVRVWEKQA